MKLNKYLSLFICTFFILLLIPILIGTIGTSVAQAQCVIVFGREICGSDIDPTRIIPGSAEAAEEAWAIAGRTGYPAAARWMEKNNGRGQSLDETQKQYLRPWFDSLVDDVAVIYNANLMDEWSAAGYRIDVGNSHQTYCWRIYIDDPYQTGELNQVFDQLVDLAHELVHSKQCQALASEVNFGYQYFKEYKRAGQNYRNNIMEQEAYKLESEFRKWLNNQRSATQQATTIRACNESAHWAIGAGVAFWSNSTDDWSTYGSAFIPQGECRDITLPKSYTGPVHMLGFVTDEPAISWGPSRFQNWFCVFAGIADPKKYYLANAATVNCASYPDCRRVLGTEPWDVRPGLNTFSFR
ncbi:hypothetical protein [Trichocoleus sp. DQ-U1]|uniref:hypothetical protein n=1 Tax=Trichocoleus sp. DQ-U1 TaxID=2933926 RepID=UPI003297FAD3